MLGEDNYCSIIFVFDYRLTANDLAKIKSTQMKSYPQLLRDAVAETEKKIAKLFERRLHTEEDFRELLAHLKAAEKKRSIGRNLDIAA